jgi:integrase
MTTRNAKIPPGVRVATLKDGSLRYRVRIDVGVAADGSRKQAMTTHRTLADAKSALSKTAVAVESGQYTPRDKVTVGQYLDRWLLGKRNLRDTTRESYRYDLKAARTKFEHTPLQRLTKADVDALVTDLLSTGGIAGKGRSARTVTLLLVLLQQVLDAAVRERLIQVNVARLVERPRGEPTVVGRAWSPADAKTFLATAGTDRYAAAWRLSLCGLRRGEVLGLHWSAIDLDADTARVETSRVLRKGTVVENAPKTKAGIRTVPLLPEVVADLRVLKRTVAAERLAAGPGRRADEDLVFIDEQGIPLRPEAYADEFRRLSRAAKLPKIRLHDLRHTSATLLASSGIPATTAARLLGHDPVVYARTYVHPDQADLRLAAEALGAAISGSA